MSEAKKLVAQAREHVYAYYRNEHVLDAQEDVLALCDEIERLEESLADLLSISNDLLSLCNNQELKLIDAREAAELLNVSVSVLGEWRRMGIAESPAYYKLGPGRNAPIRYDKEELLSWVESRKRTP